MFPLRPGKRKEGQRYVRVPSFIPSLGVSGLSASTAAAAAAAAAAENNSITITNTIPGDRREGGRIVGSERKKPNAFSDPALNISDVNRLSS